ncbi:MAG: helix-turn-helix domain-containing protein [Bacillota bacterium]|uniref:helix-turn-helix domain-containing protein n=1 Tax=Virgibacillus sp. Bac332 TaxID=2419842 RepID=UPI000EF4B3BC|nr:helix-turn-helix transcriptional regulator [Virgibacillus sp. Bac332]
MNNELEHRRIFSERLSLLIKYKGITSADLARAIDASPALITKYTSAKASPSYENFIKIADYFNVSMDYLRGKSDSLDGDPKGSDKIDHWMDLFESIDLNEVQEEKIIKYLKLLIGKLG